MNGSWQCWKATDIFTHLLNNLLLTASVPYYFRCHNHVSSNRREMSISTLSQLALRLYTSVNEQLIITQSGNWYADHYSDSFLLQKIQKLNHVSIFLKEEKKSWCTKHIFQREIVSDTTSATIPTRSCTFQSFTVKITWLQEVLWSESRAEMPCAKTALCFSCSELRASRVSVSGNAQRFHEWEKPDGCSVRWFGASQFAAGHDEQRGRCGM